MKYLFKSKALACLIAVFDFFGYLIFRVGRSVEKKPAPVKHALLVRLDHLGDIWPATAVPKILKESLGVTRVTFLTSSLGAELLKENPFVDEVLVYDAPWFSRSKKRLCRETYWGTLNKLKKLNIDLGISLRGDLRENFLLFGAGIPRRIGYGVTGGGFFLTREIAYRFEKHEREHSLDLLRSIGAETPTLCPKVYFSTDEEAAFELSWAGRGLGRDLTIGVQLEAGLSSKEWDRKDAGRFLEACADKFRGHRLVFVGTESERFLWVSDFLGKNPELPWVNLIGKTSVRELLYCLRRFSLFVGPDSGPTHIAASFGTPTLFLHSGTNVFEKWKSLEEKADFLRNPVPCSPCHLIKCPVKGHPCMSGIKIDDAIDWLLMRIHGRR